MYSAGLRCHWFCSLSAPAFTATRQRHNPTVPLLLCCGAVVLLQVSVSRRKEVSGLASMIRHFHMADVGEEDTVFDSRSFLL